MQLNSSFKLNKYLAEFYGILIGDGCISKFLSKNRFHHAIRIDGNSITDVEYYNYLKKLIYKITKRDPKIGFRKNKNALYLTFEHKELANFLNKRLGFPFGKKKEIKIHNKIVKNKRLIKYLLRGFFDTDGCIYFTKNNSKIRYYPIIELSTHSSCLIKQLKQILESFGFTIKISYYKDSVKLHGKKNVIKWMKEIGSKNPYRIKRFSNWKENNFVFKYEPDGI